MNERRKNGMEDRIKKRVKGICRREAGVRRENEPVRHATNVIAVVVDERFMIKTRLRREIELARIPKLA